MTIKQEGFDRFWSEYPKKRSKGDAFKAWCVTAPKRPSIDKIIKALVFLKASPDWQKDAGQYVPYPGTWLRAWGWEDVAEVELGGVVNGKMWWQTNAGIEAKAVELGIPAWNGRFDDEPETWQQWARRVKEIAEVGKVVSLKRVA